MTSSNPGGIMMTRIFVFFVMPSVVAVVSAKSLNSFSVVPGVGTESTVRLPVVPYMVPCGFGLTCDLRTHYCDTILDTCARCDDDCHPGRINGNKAAIDECNKVCAWYYVFTTPKATTEPTAAANLKAIAAVYNTADHTGAMAESRMLQLVTVSAACVTAVCCLVVVIYLLVHRTCYRRSDHQRYHAAPVTTSSHHNLIYNPPKKPLAESENTACLMPSCTASSASVLLTSMTRDGSIADCASPLIPAESAAETFQKV